MMMRRAATLLILISALALGADAPKFKTWISPDHFDFRAIMGDPPADDSKEHEGEIAVMLYLQETRTPEQIARCKSEETLTIFAFSTVLGDDFTAEKLPKTAAFIKALAKQASPINAAAKKAWGRLRPPLADPRIKPCVAIEDSTSYPSGHASRSMMWATLLSEIFPDQKDALIARAREMGFDRNIGGVHWPSDVVAGQKLGKAIAEQLLKDDDFKLQFEEMKTECQAAIQPVAVNSTQPVR